MVIDARRSNCHFRDPEHVELATGAALSQLVVAEDKDLFVGHVDIVDAFYQFELPAELRPFFGLPAVLSADVFLGKDGPRSQKVFPCLKVLPMGWSHAMWWCQLLHRRIIENE
eukprot:2717381-Karenia_brevis.AAC.1